MSAFASSRHGASLAIGHHGTPPDLRPGPMLEQSLPLRRSTGAPFSLHSPRSSRLTRHTSAAEAYRVDCVVVPEDWE